MSVSEAAKAQAIKSRDAEQITTGFPQESQDLDAFSILSLRGVSFI